MTRAMDSLGLLPSGPDPVGEWLVHHQPPGRVYGRFTCTLQVFIGVWHLLCGRYCEFSECPERAASRNCQRNIAIP